MIEVIVAIHNVICKGWYGTALEKREFICRDDGMERPAEMRTEGDWAMLEEGIADQLRNSTGPMKDRIKSLRLVAFDRQSGRVVVFTNGKRIMIDENGKVTKETLLNPEIRSIVHASVSSLAVEDRSEEEARNTMVWSFVVTVFSLVAVLFANFYLLK